MKNTKQAVLKKKAKQLCCILLTVILCMGMTVPVMAASSKYNAAVSSYGIKVKSVNLPVKKGKYLLKELWWQDETVMKYYKAVRTKTGATITIRGNCFGKYAGKEVITVKPARNSMGFVITSMRYYRAGK